MWGKIFARVQLRSCRPGWPILIIFISIVWMAECLETHIEKPPSVCVAITLHVFYLLLLTLNTYQQIYSVENVLNAGWGIPDKKILRCVRNSFITRSQMVWQFRCGINEVHRSYNLLDIFLGVVVRLGKLYFPQRVGQRASPNNQNAWNLGFHSLHNGFKHSHMQNRSNKHSRCILTATPICLKGFQTDIL